MKYPWKSGVPKVAFITGGGSGLGRQFAKLLLGEGASVALFDLRFDDAVVQELQAMAGASQRFLTLPVDITDAAGVDAAVAQAVKALGAPDLAINSAGIAVNSTFEALTQAAFEKVVTVNLFGSRNFAAAVLPHMRPGARLALVASLAGRVGSFGYAAYGASKFGVVGLAEVLRIEQKLRGIEISVICPGEVATPMVAEEARTMHPVSRALKDVGGTLTVDVACDAMMRELARGRFTIIPGLQSKLTNILATRCPGLLRRVIDGKARQAWNAMQRGAARVAAE